MFSINKPAAIFLLIVLSVSGAFGQNLLQNPGFENWDESMFPIDWNMSVANMQRDNSTVRDGSYSLMICPGGNNYVYQDVFVDAEESYMFRIWLTDNFPNSGANVALAFFDSYNNMIGEEISGRYSWDSEGWQSLTAVAVAPENSIYMRATIRFWGTEWLNIDDCWVGSEMSIQNAKTKNVDDPVLISGIVLNTNNKFGDLYSTFYIQNGNSGIRIFDYWNEFGSELQRGDEILIGGNFGHPSGPMSQIASIEATTYIRVSTGNDLPEPLQYSTDSFAQNAFENEGVLATMSGMATFEDVGTHKKIILNDGSGDGQVFVYSFANLDFSAFYDGARIKVTGIVGAYNQTNQLWPTEQEEIEFIENSITPREINGIDIYGRVGIISESRISAILDENGSEGYDSGLDIPKPAMPSNNYVDVYFPVSGETWDDMGISRLMQETRLNTDLSERFEVYNLIVKSDQIGQSCTLAFAPGNLITSENSIYLYDLYNHSLCNLRYTLEYYFDVTENDRLFQILIGNSNGPQLEIFEPSDNSVFEVGEVVNIQWSLTDIYPINSLSLSYFNGTDETVIENFQGNPEQYSWTIPNDLFENGSLILSAENNNNETGTDSVRISIVDNTDPVVEGFTFPQSSTLAPASPLTISWTSISDNAGINSIEVYSKINEEEYELEATLWNVASEYSFFVPNLVGDSVQLKLVASDENANYTELETSSYLIEYDEQLNNGSFEEWNSSEDKSWYWFRSDDSLIENRHIDSDPSPHHGEALNMLHIIDEGTHSLYQTISEIESGEEYGLRVFINDAN